MKNVSAFLLLIMISAEFYGQKPELIVPVGHTDKINSIRLTDDGKFMISASDDKTCKIWDVSSGKLLRTIKGDQSFTIGLLSPDLKTINTLNENGIVGLTENLSTYKMGIFGICGKRPFESVFDS